MIILWDNYIDGATITPSTELVSKPISNISSSDLTKQFAFNNNSGYIVLDLLSEKYITDFMLCGTNVTDDNTTIKLQGNTTDDFTTPAYTVDLELYDNGNLGIGGINSSFRYWKVTIEDTTVSDILLGWIYIGDKLQLPPIDPSISLNYNTNTAATFSISQQIYANKGIEYFSSDFTFPMIYDYEREIDGKVIATREDILEFWYTNRGASPFILVIWDDSRNRFAPIVGVIAQNTLTFKLDKTQCYYSMGFDFIETK